MKLKHWTSLWINKISVSQGCEMAIKRNTKRNETKWAHMQMRWYENVAYESMVMLLLLLFYSCHALLLSTLQMNANANANKCRPCDDKDDD